MQKKVTEASASKIVAVRFNKRIVQAELTLENLIMNNFGMRQKFDMTEKHLKDKTIKTDTKFLPPKTIDGEVYSHIEFDRKGRVAFLSRHIMAALVDAFNISVTDQDNKRKNPKSFRKCVRVEGVEEAHFCPINFNPKLYRTRIDNVVLQGGVSSTTIRPMFCDCSIRCNIIFHEDIVSEESVLNILARAGDCVGLGAWTPQYSSSFGLFKVRVLKPSRKDPAKKIRFDKKLIEKGLGLFLKENSDTAAAKNMIERLHKLKIAA